jgi:hypothetical protein
MITSIIYFIHMRKGALLQQGGGQNGGQMRFVSKILGQRSSSGALLLAARSHVKLKEDP